MPRIPPNNNIAINRPRTNQTEQANQTEQSADIASTADVATQPSTDQLQTNAKPTPSLIGADGVTAPHLGSIQANDPRLQGTDGLDPRNAIPRIGTSKTDPVTHGIDLNIPQVGRAEEMLNLDAMNADYNPFRDVIGDFTNVEQAFQSKVLWPSQTVAAGLFLQAIPGLPDDGGPLSQLKALAGSLNTMEMVPPDLQKTADESTKIAKAVEGYPTAEGGRLDLEQRLTDLGFADPTIPLDTLLTSGHAGRRRLADAMADAGLVERAPIIEARQQDAADRATRLVSGETPTGSPEALREELMGIAQQLGFMLGDARTGVVDAMLAGPEPAGEILINGLREREMLTIRPVISDEQQMAIDGAANVARQTTQREKAVAQLSGILGGLGVEGPAADQMLMGMLSGAAPAGEVLLGALREAGKLPQIPLIVAAMQENSVTMSSAHQFRLADGEIGNNVVLYGTNAANPTVGHSGIDAVAHEVAKNGGRLLKVMSHVDKAGQGGTPEDIVKGGVLGVTHTGGYSAGWKDGEPVSIASDWPSNYGRMDNGNRNYNAVLMTVDIQGGTRKEVPQENLEWFKQNTDMFDVFASIVPFSSGDRDSRFTTYTYNPLEVHDRESAVDFGKALLTLDSDHLLKEHGAFYCAEGQYAVNSMGSQGGLLMKKSEFGDTAAGKMIDAFQKIAEELTGETVEVPDAANPGEMKEVVVDDPRKFPNIIWERLKSVDPAEGGITEKMYDGLDKTKRTSAYLEWIPEEAKGLEAFDPINEEGMIAQPQTIATMAWSVLRSAMPIDKMGGTIADQMLELYNRELPADASFEEVALQTKVKEDIGKFLGDVNANPVHAQRFGEAVANILMLKVIDNDEFMETMLAKSGFKEINNEPDKEKFKATYREFVDGLKGLAVKGASVEERDAFLGAMDDKFRNMEVTRDLRVWVDGVPELDSAGNEVVDDDGNTVWATEPRDELVGTKTGPMLYAAPATNLFNAQNAEEHHSMIKYITYAMHVDQATSPDFVDKWKDHFLPLAEEMSSIRYDVAVDDASLYPEARPRMEEALRNNAALFADNGVELTDELIEQCLVAMTRQDGAVAAGARLETIISPLLVAAQDD